MKRYKLIILICIVLLGIFFRFFRLNEIPYGLYPDEAMNGNNALEALNSHDYKIFYPENNGRPGLFANLEAASLATFGHHPWALRGVSAVIGSLTVLAVFFLSRELFSRRGGRCKQTSAPSIGLIAAFFTATSYWHVNFSRIGFEAILIPLMSSCALYFLLKGLRTKNIWTLVAAGFFTGLGFYAHSAFWFFIFVAVIPLFAELYSYFHTKTSSRDNKQISWTRVSCTPCAVTLYLFVVFVLALPLGIYFLGHPEQFTGGLTSNTVFSTVSPAKEFLVSNIKTWGMFFVRGDCNWRHNFSCLPELVWPVAFFFTAGIFITVRDMFKRTYEQSRTPYILLAWLIIMSLPATLMREGNPHALRAIGMIPPVIMLAALGFWRFSRALLDFFEHKKNHFPEKIPQLGRIQKELKVMLMLLLLFLPIYTYRTYFIHWVSAPDMYFGFSTDLYHAGEFLRDRPADVSAYVIVNIPGTDVRGISVWAQTIMFVTDTFRASEQERQHITYVRTDQFDRIRIQKGEKVVFVFLNGDDKQSASALQKKFPDFKIRAPSDFVILENYY